MFLNLYLPNVHSFECKRTQIRRGILIFLVMYICPQNFIFISLRNYKVVQTAVSILLSLSFMIKLTHGSVFQVNHTVVRAPKFYFPASMDQTARYSMQEGIKIVEAYSANKSVVQTQRQFRRDFPGRNAPISFTTKRFLDKFRETGSLQANIKSSQWPETVSQHKKSHRDRETTLRVKSTKRLSWELDPSKSSVMRIMHQDLHLFPYKIQTL